jgi:hypothetical protein
MLSRVGLWYTVRRCGDIASNGRIAELKMIWKEAIVA